MKVRNVTCVVSERLECAEFEVGGGVGDVGLDGEEGRAALPDAAGRVHHLHAGGVGLPTENH